MYSVLRFHTAQDIAHEACAVQTRVCPSRSINLGLSSGCLSLISFRLCRARPSTPVFLELENSYGYLGSTACAEYWFLTSQVVVKFRVPGGESCLLMKVAGGQFSRVVRCPSLGVSRQLSTFWRFLVFGKASRKRTGPMVMAIWGIFHASKRLSARMLRNGPCRTLRLAGSSALSVGSTSTLVVARTRFSSLRTYRITS